MNLSGLLKRKDTSRSKLAFFNLLGVVGQKAIKAVIGLIIPKLLLESFGSAVNGTVSSITSFLAVITLLQGGFDSVAKTAFYKPLANNDSAGISKVFNSADSFFKKIAVVFGIYCVALAFLFPTFNDNGQKYLFNVLLVLILAFSSFAEEYFGITYIVLLNADQRSSITSVINIACTVLNAILIILLIQCGAGILLVEFVSALVFLLRPVFVVFVGKSFYHIDRKAPKEDRILSEKWNNFGVTVANFVHSKVDYIVMTFMVSMEEISVYSIYALVTGTLQGLISALSTGFVPGLGNMYAKGETDTFKRNFSLYEFVNTFFTMLFYCTAGIMLIPFVRLYTANVTDADYVRPVFGYLLVLATVAYCLRLPYNYAIVNARHFVQMKKPAIIEVAINLVVSVALVIPFGITGLAVGTLAGSVFNTLYLVIYCSKNVTHESVLSFLKRTAIATVSCMASIVTCNIILPSIDSFLLWFVWAVVVVLITAFWLLLTNVIFYRQDCKNMCRNLSTLLKRG